MSVRQIIHIQLLCELNHCYYVNQRLFKQLIINICLNIFDYCVAIQKMHFYYYFIIFLYNFMSLHDLE